MGVGSRQALVRHRRGALVLLLFPVLALADLRILHLDVGMGDATLIVDTASRRSLLVDSGNRGYGRTVVVPALRRLGIEQLTYFLATHYDADHIGGLDEVLEAGIGLNEALDRGNHTDREPKTATDRYSQYGEYLKAVEDFGASRRRLEPRCMSRADAAIDLGAETQIEVVAAAGRYLVDDNGTCRVADREVDDSRDNALSVALVIRHKGFDYFIGGDLTGGGNRTVPMEDLVAPWVGDVDVLRLNHHGSATSSSAAFLAALRPEVAVISVGDGGVNLRYRLPRQTVLDRIAELRPPPLVFQTHRGEGGQYDGAHIEDRHIVIHTDGHGYTVNGKICSVDERVTVDSQEACR